MSFNDFSFDSTYTPDQGAAMNKGVNPIFFVEPVENPAKSAIEGRPIFDELERVRIMVAGDPFTASVQPVTQEVKDRFPIQYVAFERQRTERHITGTPITEWPIITRARASELHALDIFSVENLACVSDANVMRLGPDGRALRAKALAYLDNAKDGAAIAAIASENERLKADMADLQTQVKVLADRLAAAQADAANRKPAETSQQASQREPHHTQTKERPRVSLLSLVQDACRDLSITVPTSVFANTDPDIQKLQGFAKRAGDEFRERWTWRNLIAGGTITGDGVTTLFPLPDLFGSLTPSELLVSSVDTLPLIGPVNAEALLLMKARVETLARKVFRFVGGAIEIYPAPAAGEIVTFEYHSKGWVLRAADGKAQTTWSADPDRSLIDETLLSLAAIWRWKRSNGLDYAEEFRSCESAFERLSAQENTGRSIAMSHRPSCCLADTLWPGTVQGS